MSVDRLAGRDLQVGGWLQSGVEVAKGAQTLCERGCRPDDKTPSFKINRAPWENGAIVCETNTAGQSETKRRACEKRCSGKSKTGRRDTRAGSKAPGALQAAGKGVPASLASVVCIIRTPACAATADAA